MWFGDRLQEHADIDRGDFIYIPAGIPHLPYNPSETETCTAVIARTDPNEQRNQCWFPRTIIQVKAKYNLSIDAREKAALRKLLDDC